MITLNFIPNYLPNLHALLTEAPKIWRTELSAGLTTASLLIPQSMAYAMLAGLPAQVGLYAALMPIVAYTLLGSAKTLSVGPVAMDSLLTLATLNGIAVIMSKEYIAIASLLAFCVGIILVLMYLLNVGKLVQYLSSGMMGGFTSAAAIIIALSQLKYLLGAPLEQHIAAHTVLIEVYEKLDLLNPLTLIIGLCSLIIFKGLPKLNDKLPVGLVGILSMILIAYSFSFETKGVAIIGNIPEGLPSLTIPNIDQLMMVLTGKNGSQFIGGALSIALLAYMEAIAIGTAVAKDKGYQIRPGQELLALGGANISSSFFGAYPVAGGFSRTAVNDQARAKTPLASLITCSIVALVIWQFTPALYHLPKTTLAAMIIAAVIGLIDLETPKRLLVTDKIQAINWFLTFISTLSLGLQKGILIGVIFSLINHFCTTYKANKNFISSSDKEP